MLIGMHGDSEKVYVGEIHVHCECRRLCKQHCILSSVHPMTVGACTPCLPFLNKLLCLLFFLTGGFVLMQTLKGAAILY